MKVLISIIKDLKKKKNKKTYDEIINYLREKELYLQEKKKNEEDAKLKELNELKELNDKKQEEDNTEKVYKPFIYQPF